MGSNGKVSRFVFFRLVCGAGCQIRVEELEAEAWALLPLTSQTITAVQRVLQSSPCPRDLWLPASPVMGYPRVGVPPKPREVALHFKKGEMSPEDFRKERRDTNHIISAWCKLCSVKHFHLRACATFPGIFK